jgi:hypothetical protein
MLRKIGYARLVANAIPVPINVQQPHAIFTWTHVLDSGLRALSPWTEQRAACLTYRETPSAKMVATRFSFTHDTPHPISDIGGPIRVAEPHTTLLMQIWNREPCYFPQLILTIYRSFSSSFSPSSTISAPAPSAPSPPLCLNAAMNSSYRSCTSLSYSPLAYL